jgi:GH24 family phage-related lysozyme (muramidase)
MDWFEKDVRRRAEILARELEGVPVTQELFNTMVSLSYNVGTAAVIKSKCIECLKNGDLKQKDPKDPKDPEEPKKAKEHFLEWCKYKDPKTGKLEVSRGLQRRREKEAVAFDDKIQIQLMAEYKNSLLRNPKIASK